MLASRIKSTSRQAGSVVVVAELFDNSGPIVERRFAYPLDVEPDVIRLDVANMISVYQREKEIGEATAASEVANAKADETIESLQNFEVHEEG